MIQHIQTEKLCSAQTKFLERVRRLHTRTMLLQYPDDLPFTATALLHALSSLNIKERTPALRMTVRAGDLLPCHRTGPTVIFYPLVLT